jgi:hypothetical protein
VELDFLRSERGGQLELLLSHRRLRRSAGAVEGRATQGQDHVRPQEDRRQHFTVQLDSPFVGFPATLGYPGFSPMAKACLADTKACKEKPIGNGRYKIDDKWKHNVEVKVVRSDS